MATMVRYSVPAGVLLFLLLGASACLGDGPIDPGESVIPPLEPVSGDTTVTAEGLVIIEIEPGSGEEEAIRGREVEVAYTLWLEASGRGVEQDTLRFVVGTSEVIEGFSRGVEGMRTGGERRLVIPPELGYGEEGTASIPPDATLVFDVHLLEIRPRN